MSRCSTDGNAFSVYSNDWGLLFNENAKGNTIFDKEKKIFIHRHKKMNELNPSI